MSKYQIMPPLSDEQFEALKADISTAGIRVPIEVDENGEVIDGHHRRAIAMELGIECPETVIRGLAEFEKMDRAFVLNATRRHFDREQKRAVIVKSLMLHPRLADREHARRCGVSHPTVSGVRAALEAAGRLESFTSRVSGDGRERPAHNEPTRTAPETAAGNANAPADGENPTAFQGSPATGAGASEADRPAPVVTPTDHPESADSGEAEDSASSAADGHVPPAPQAGPETSSPEDSEPADGREQQDPAGGVPAPAAPAPAKTEETAEEAAAREDLEFRTDRTLEFSAALVNLTMRLGTDPIAWFESVYLPGVFANRNLPRVRDCFEPKSLHNLAAMLDALGEYLTQTGKTL